MSATLMLTAEEEERRRAALRLRDLLAMTQAQFAAHMGVASKSELANREVGRSRWSESDGELIRRELAKAIGGQA